MNLLLLLSALLSALAGIGPSARAPSVPQTAARPAEGTQIAAVLPRVTHRPSATLPTRRQVASASVRHAFTIAVIPAWSNRRRE